MQGTTDRVRHPPGDAVQVADTIPTDGKGGPITVVNARDTGSPISQAYLDGCAELVYPIVDDFNATLFEPAGTTST